VKSFDLIYVRLMDCLERPLPVSPPPPSLSCPPFSHSFFSRPPHRPALKSLKKLELRQEPLRTARDYRTPLLLRLLCRLSSESALSNANLPSSPSSPSPATNYLCWLGSDCSFHRERRSEHSLVQAAPTISAQLNNGLELDSFAPLDNIRSLSNELNVE